MTSAINCHQCNTTFPPSTNETKKVEGKFHFCSDECHSKWFETREITVQDGFTNPSQAAIKTESKGKVLVQEPPAFDFDGMDKSAKIEESFYQWAGGNWAKNNPIPEGYSRWGTFHVLNKQVNDDILNLLNGLDGAEEKEAVMAHSLFKSALDIDTRNKEGIRFLDELLQRAETEEITSFTSELHKQGIRPFFSWGVGPNPENSAQNILHVGEGGLNLPDFEMYLEKYDTEANKHSEKREQYREYIETILKHTGFFNADSADKIIRFETELAKLHMSKEDARDPDKTTHLMKPNELPIHFKKLFNTPNIVNCDNPAFFERLSELLKEGDYKEYLKFSIINDAVSASDMKSYEITFNFYGTLLNGTKKPLPLDERSANATSGTLGDAVGKLYVKKHFPPARKELANDMVEGIKKALVDKIQKLVWMQEETKEKAIEKVETMLVQIAYPDQGLWTDYTALTSIDKSRPYALNLQDVAIFKTEEKLNKIDKPVNQLKWPWPPQVVNACNCPDQNKIVFPAGILGHPFFTSDEAVTWGGFGMVIAHEIIHSFDDQGRKYDAKGNKADWWQESDVEAFKKHAQVVEEQFNNYALTFSDGTSANVRGGLTLGENIADLGGIIMAFAAMKERNLPTIDGWTAEQRFFLGYSQIWRANRTEEAAKNLLNSDPHSPPKFRVNGPLSHLPEFKRAFNLPDDCPMVVSEENRSKMWKE